MPKVCDSKNPKGCLGIRRHFASLPWYLSGSGVASFAGLPETGNSEVLLCSNSWQMECMRKQRQYWNMTQTCTAKWNDQPSPPSTQSIKSSNPYNLYNLQAHSNYPSDQLPHVSKVPCFLYSNYIYEPVGSSQAWFSQAWQCICNIGLWQNVAGGSVWNPAWAT